MDKPNAEAAAPAAKAQTRTRLVLRSLLAGAVAALALG